MMSENTKLLDEETVPSALEIARTGYEIQEGAEEVKKEEVKKGRRLTCYLWIIALAIIALIALVIFICLKVL